MVIGNGNVALDIGRLLARSAVGRSKTDLPTYAREAMDASPIKDVYLFGRRGPADAKFTNVELREMLDLTESISVVDPAILPDSAPEGFDDRAKRLAEKNLDTMRAFADRDPSKFDKRVHFEFYASPVEILGDHKVTGIRMERTKVVDGRAMGTGEMFDVPCELVVAAIGYRAEPIEGLPYDEERGIIPNDMGRIDHGMYAVGWIKRGPSGVISSSRPDAAQVIDHIAADFGADEFRGSKPGRQGFERALKERNIRAVSFADWKALEDAELARATHPSPRQKFTDVDDMMEHLDGPKS